VGGGGHGMAWAAASPWQQPQAANISGTIVFLQGLLTANKLKFRKKLFNKKNVILN